MGTKKCIFCAETIQLEAIKCKHCGEWIQKPKNANSKLQAITNTLKNYNSQLENKKTEHLYIPSDDKPFLFNEFTFFSNTFKINGIQYYYHDICSLYMLSKQTTFNFITDYEINFKLLLNRKSGKDFPLENRLNDDIIDLSAESFMIYRNKKNRDKSIFLYEFLSNLTFKLRLQRYIDCLQIDGYFTYPYEIKIYRNGDVYRANQLKGNIVEAYRNGKLVYGDSKFLSLTGNYSSDPYLFQLNRNNSSLSFFGSNNLVSFYIYYDRDVFNSLIDLIINPNSI